LTSSITSLRCDFDATSRIAPTSAIVDTVSAVVAPSGSSIHAPRAGAAANSRPLVGWNTTPTIGRCATHSPIITAKPSLPRMKSLVPSIGSTYQTRGAVRRARSSADSSLTTQSAGNAARSPATIRSDAARSATVTGSSPALCSTPSAAGPRSRIATARAPASRASWLAISISRS